MTELISYDDIDKQFKPIRNELKSLYLQNLLSELVDLESKYGDLETNNTYLEKYCQEMNSKNNTYTMIKNLYSKIYKNFSTPKAINNVITITNFSIIKIDYPTIISINQILVSFLSTFIEKKGYEKKLEALFHREYTISLPPNFQKYLDDFQTIKTVNIKLSDVKQDREINLDYILFFYTFFDILFPYFLEVNIDLNIERVNYIYHLDKNPYKITETNIINIGKKHENIFIANAFMSKLIAKNEKIQKINLKLYDSYMIELRDLTRNINPDFIYFDNLLFLNNLFSINCEFNSLDSGLFEKINYLLIKNISLESLTLDLFPERLKFCNFYKILKNAQKSKNGANKIINEIDRSECETDFIHLYGIRKNYSEDLSNNLILSNEKIFKYLFSSFQANMENLLLIIERKIKTLKYLKICINPYPILMEYDNYNCLIACFIMNIFTILNNYKNNIELVNLEIYAPNFYFDYSVLKKENNIKEKPDEYSIQNLKLLNLKLNLKMNHLLTNFKGFPIEHLNTLSMEDLEIEDFTKFSKFIYSKMEINNDNILYKLKELTISLAVFDNNSKNFEEIVNFFKNKKPCNLEKLNFNTKNNINIDGITGIIESVAFNKYPDVIRMITLNVYRRKYADINALKLIRKVNNNILFVIKKDDSCLTVDLYKFNQIFMNNFLKIMYMLERSKQLNKLGKHTVIKQRIAMLLYGKKNKTIIFN